MAPGCYNALGAPFSLNYIGPENTVDNINYHGSIDCSGPSIAYTMVRAIPNTPEQAALLCAELVSGSSPFNVGGNPAAIPTDAWVCFVPPPPEMSVPDDFRVGATSVNGAEVHFSVGLNASGSHSCSPSSGSLFPIDETLVTCTAILTSGDELTDSFTIAVTEDPLWADGGCYAGFGADLFYNGYENTAGNAALRPSSGGFCFGQANPVSIVRVESGDAPEITALCQSLGHAVGTYFKANDNGYTLPADAYVCTA